MLRPTAAAVVVTGLLALPSSAAAQPAPASGPALAQDETTPPPVPSSSLSFAKTAYAGTDSGAGCGGAGNYAEAGADEVVTYCFTVTNTGTTHLGSITIIDPHVSAPITSLGADSMPLAPGQSARYYVESTPPPDDADGAVDDTFTNTASVSATAVDEDGNRIPDSGPVGASAQAVVFPPEVVPEPAVALTTSAYAGADGGAGCPADDVTVASEGEPITYCYAVTNTGNTHLDAIAFEHFGLEGSAVLARADSQPLAPGHQALYYIETAAPALPPEGLIVTSSVVANSVDGQGADLSGMADVTGRDGTEIQATVRAPTPAAAPPVSTHEAAPRPEADAAPQPEPQAAPRSEPKSAPAVPAAQAVPTPAAGAVAQAPTQLAYTGWESWIVAVAGIGLLAGGWAIVRESVLRREPVPSPVRRGDDHRRWIE